MTELSQYRCDNGCLNRKGCWDVPFCDFWSKEFPISKYGVELIAHIGCTSHSNHQSEQSIRQDAVNIALGDLKERIKTIGFEMKDEAAFLYLVEYVETHLDEIFYLEELRSKQGEQP